MIRALKHSLRRLRLRPTATIVAILVLATSLGAALVAWTVFSRTLLRPLNLPRADEVSLVTVRDTPSEAVRHVHTYRSYDTLRSVDPKLQMAGVGSWRLSVGTDSDGPPATVSFVSRNYFPILGIGIDQGRIFSDADDQRGAFPVAIVTGDLWERDFAGRRLDDQATLVVQGRPVRIIGVTKPGFRGLSLSQPAEVFMPLHIVADIRRASTNYFAEPTHQSSPHGWLQIIARVPNPASGIQFLGQLQGALSADSSLQLGLESVQSVAIDQSSRADIRGLTALCLGAVGMLMVVGFVAVATLLLLQVEARRHEFAISLALGASRRQLVATVVIDSFILALAGLVAALPVTFWLFRILETFSLPGGIQLQALSMSVDRELIAVGSLLALGLPLLVAAAAALSRLQPLTLLTQSGLGSRSWMIPLSARRFLLILQVSAAVVLLSGVGLFVKSLMVALDVNPQVTGAALFSSDLRTATTGPSIDRSDSSYSELLAQLRGTNAVISAALSSWQAEASDELHVDGQKTAVPGAVQFIAVDDSWFTTAGLPLREGRPFSADDGAGGPPVAIVSQSLARALGNLVIGRTIKLPSSRDGKAPQQPRIVGVVGDLVTDLAVRNPQVVYLSRRQVAPSPIATVMVRTQDSHLGRQIVERSLVSVRTRLRSSPTISLDDMLWTQLAPQRFALNVLGALATIASLMILLGAYSLSQAAIALQRHELSVRAALGANRRHLLVPIIFETGRCALIGAVVGLALAIAGARATQHLLVDASAFDVKALAIGSAAAVLVAVAAALPAALQASRPDISGVMKSG